MSYRDMVDHYTRLYAIAQSYVISETSGNIQRDKIAMLEKVNKDREAAGFGPIDREYVGIYWEPEE